MTDFIKLVKQGDASAQYELAVRYFYGKGVEQDYNKAIFWLQKAAEQGLADAQNDIAHCYEEGNIVSQNYYIAFDWYKKAALNGHLEAMNQLGFFYRFGQGCTKDYDQAISWWEEAADRGNANAIYNLGVAYAEGEIVKRNLSKATELFLQAEELGCELASSALANMDDENYDEDYDYNEDSDDEFKEDKFNYSIEVAREIYRNLRTQEEANEKFDKEIKLYFQNKGQKLKCSDGPGITGFDEIVYQCEEQKISVLISYNNSPYIYAIVLSTNDAYTRCLFEEGLSKKSLFGLPIFRMQWFNEMNKAFIYFMTRDAYLQFDTPSGRMEKDLFGF